MTGFIKTVLANFVVRFLSAWWVPGGLDLLLYSSEVD
jgi:hypothetical protein